jgi:transcriptional regulator with GAF, ATPase, and Fis domain
MPLHLQVKILRALQEQQIRPVGEEQLINVDVRVIAATLRDLEDDVVEGRFRDDLYYRLNVVTIHIPALRERPEDIPVLIQHFVKKHNKRLGLNIKQVDADALKAMLAYNWKGNVRDLPKQIQSAWKACRCIFEQRSRRSTLVWKKSPTTIYQLSKGRAHLRLL